MTVEEETPSLDIVACLLSKLMECFKDPHLLPTFWCIFWTVLNHHFLSSTPLKMLVGHSLGIPVYFEDVIFLFKAAFTDDARTMLNRCIKKTPTLDPTPSKFLLLHKDALK